MNIFQAQLVLGDGRTQAERRFGSHPVQRKPCSSAEFLAGMRAIKKRRGATIPSEDPT